MVDAVLELCSYPMSQCGVFVVAGFGLEIRSKLRHEFPNFFALILPLQLKLKLNWNGTNLSHLASLISDILICSCKVAAKNWLQE